jgi:5'-AMP-activated protein kinase catalytic alpha subunit
MNEVYKAMQSLQCVWHQVTNYRVLCLWTHIPNAGCEKNHTLSSSILDQSSRSSSNTGNSLSWGGKKDVMDDEEMNILNVDNGEMDMDDITSAGGNSNRQQGVLQDSSVKIALSLYKVQQNIYLLDFQRVEGDAFGFMKLSALIITELKTLSAASRSAAPPQQPVNPNV